MSDGDRDPYAGPNDGSSAVTLRRSGTSDLLAALGVVAAVAGLATFVGYWIASAATTDAWFFVTLGFMSLGLLLGLGALMLSRRRDAPRGRAIAAMVLALLPVALVVLFYAATWGIWFVEAAVYRLLGIGY